MPDDLSESDVLVVGAGAAGASAAFEAAIAGARVRGLDCGSKFGGTARRGGGGICIAGSPMQQALGIHDSPALAFRDLIAGGNEVDEPWARAYFEGAVEDIYCWLGGLGVRFAEVRHHEGDSVPRWHAPEGAGAGLMGRVWQRFVERGFDRIWHFGWHVRDLLVEDGRIVGVVAESTDGRRREFRARAVVMATGGFAGNHDMVVARSPPLAAVPRLLVAGGLGAQGEGHDILARHSVRLVSCERVYAYATGTPDYRDEAGRRGVIVRGVRDWIWVNAEGRRFHDESRAISGRSATPDLLGQPGATAWAIFDSAVAPNLLIADHYFDGEAEVPAEAARRFLRHSQHVWRAETPDELAAKAGIDVAGLGLTLSAWNETLRDGALATDLLTGRALAGLRPIAAPPYHAVQFFPASRKTLGGVRTDLRSQVVGLNGELIKGLFAAGELAGLAGGSLAGASPLEGMMVGGAIFSGRIAGQAAVSSC